MFNCVFVKDSSAVTETGVISQDTYFSDICQIRVTFMCDIPDAQLLTAPLIMSSG